VLAAYLTSISGFRRPDSRHGPLVHTHAKHVSLRRGGQLCPSGARPSTRGGQPPQWDRRESAHPPPPPFTVHEAGKRERGKLSARGVRACMQSMGTDAVDLWRREAMAKARVAASAASPCAWRNPGMAVALRCVTRCGWFPPAGLPGLVDRWLQWRAGWWIAGYNGGGR
jgi:hypothetical protein